MLRALYTLAVASVLAVVSAFAVMRAQRLDSDAMTRFGQHARTLAALDFKLSGEVLKARGGLVQHYDGVVQTEAARKRILQALGLLLPRLPAEHSDALREHLREAGAAREALERTVERFKRENAVLRSSLRYLPLLAAEVGASDAEHAPNMLAQDELLMQAWGEAAVVARVDRELERLRALVHAPSDRQAADALRTLLSHATIIRERTPEVNRLTQQILEYADRAPTQVLLVDFAQLAERANSDAAAQTHWLFGLIVFSVVACATSVIAGLRLSASQLQRTGAQLQDAVVSEKWSIVVDQKSDQAATFVS